MLKCVSLMQNRFLTCWQILHFRQICTKLFKFLINLHSAHSLSRENETEPTVFAECKE
jgi:hypothetical protein